MCLIFFNEHGLNLKSKTNAIVYPLHGKVQRRRGCGALGAQCVVVAIVANAANFPLPCVFLRWRRGVLRMRA